LYNISTDIREKVNVAHKHPEIVTKLTKLAKEGIQKLGEYQQRGSEQRATDSLFPDVPVVVNDRDWKALPLEKIKIAEDNFTGGYHKNKNKKHK